MPREISQEQIDMIKSMTEQRFSQQAIQDKTGISKTTIRKYQRLSNLPASNRHEGGTRVLNSIPPVFEKEEKKEPEKNPGEWLILHDKTLELVGIKTNYKYTISRQSNEVVIDPLYSESLKISIDDLVAFGNELLDLADVLNDMKRNVWKY